MMLLAIHQFVSAQTKVIYTCVLHPEVKMDKPGKCPHETGHGYEDAGGTQGRNKI